MLLYCSHKTKVSIHIVRVSASETRRSTIGSARNVLHAMPLLCRAVRPLQLSEIASSLGVSEPTAFRVMQTLVEQGFAKSERPRGSGWTATMKIVEMSADLLERTELRQLAADPLQSLVDHFGETVTLAVPDNDHIVFVDRIHANSSVHFYCDTGRRLPLHAGAAARVVLAWLPQESFDAYVSRRLQPLTPKTRVTAAALRRDRAAIREQGYAVSVSDVEDGISGVAAVFVNGAGQPLGSAAIANLSSRWTETDIAKRGRALVETARVVNELCRHLRPRMVRIA